MKHISEVIESFSDVLEIRSQEYQETVRKREAWHKIVPPMVDGVDIYLAEQISRLGYWGGRFGSTPRFMAEDYVRQTESEVIYAANGKIYFVFEHLTLEQALLEANVDNLSSAEVLCLYSRWLGGYLQNIQRLYCSEGVELLEWSYSQFCEMNSLDDSLETLHYTLRREGLEEEWEIYSSESGLARVDKATSEAERVVEQYCELFDDARFRDCEIADAYSYEQIQAIFTPLWFRLVTGNNYQKQNALAHLSREEYLSSLHWLRAKTAVMMFREKRCQRCMKRQSLDVYRRKTATVGNECYEDLFILCVDCYDELSNPS
ncbi:MAG: hypothetical protein L0154_11390 [Chloroflexi bacterium]|nr:hypothetical protein [Chloroflexota bacterium]